MKLVLLVLCLLVGAECSVAQSLPEHRVKAALLYRLSKFTQWPEAVFSSDATPLGICVLGMDPFESALDRIEGKKVRGRTVRIGYYKHPVDATSECQLIYISRSEQKRLFTVLSILAEYPILTVADFERFATDGGGIGLVEEGRRISFEINLTAVEHAGIRISAQLLGLAKVIK